MIAYQKEIIENCINFIASEYKTKRGYYPSQIIVYKILAKLDFASVKEKGVSCTGMTYLALKNGPVPDELYNQDESIYTKYRTDIYQKGKVTRKDYIPVGEADLDYLSPSQMRNLKSIVTDFIDRKLTANEASEESHKLNAWLRTERNKTIDYGLVFDGDIYTKPDSELTAAEERFRLNYEFA